MDDFTFELHRGLYAEALGHATRRSATVAGGPRLAPVDQSRFLVSRVHLRRIATFFSVATVLGVLLVGWITRSSQNELTEWSQYAARTSLRQVAFTKDVELATNRAIANAKQYFFLELARERGVAGAAVGRDLQAINERVSSLEFLLRGTTAIDKLDAFQLTLEEWRNQTLAAFGDVENGRAEYALGQWTERSETLGRDLVNRSAELSALAEDFTRREQLRLDAVRERHATLLTTAWTMLFVLVLGSAWVLGNFLGAIGEFLTWFRRLSWDLLSHSERLTIHVARGDEPRLADDAQLVAGDVEEMRVVLKRLLEVFAGNIDGERFRAPPASPVAAFAGRALQILKFKNGSRKMKELLRVQTATRRAPVEASAQKRAVGE